MNIYIMMVLITHETIMGKLDENNEESKFFKIENPYIIFPNGLAQMYLPFKKDIDYTCNFHSDYIVYSETNLDNLNIEQGYKDIHIQVRNKILQDKLNIIVTDKLPGKKHGFN